MSRLLKKNRFSSIVHILLFIKILMNIQEALTFDDVLLRPGYSEILPAEADIAAQLTRKLKLKIPFVSAAMDTVTESDLAIALAQIGGIGVIHKNISVQKQAGEVKKVKKRKLLVAAAVGATGDCFERAQALLKAGVDAIVVDTAHGHSKRVIEAVKKIKKNNPSVQIIAGNIGTAEGARAIIAAGADAVKVGIGPGSICTTRIIAGVGVPQLSAILEIAPVCKKAKVPLIADGGIKFSGDVVKALAAGADTVMIGSLFAGTKESPGKIIKYKGKFYKEYRGMGSLGAMQKGSKDRYGQESEMNVQKLVPEGIEGRLTFKGNLADVVNHLTGGLKSGMGYLGAKNLKELQENAKFVRITSAGLKESHPHDVIITKRAPNYRTG